MRRSTVLSLTLQLVFPAKLMACFYMLSCRIFTHLATMLLFRAQAVVLPTPLPLGHRSQDHYIGSLPICILGSANPDHDIQQCLYQSAIWHQNVFVCTTDI